MLFNAEAEFNKLFNNNHVYHKIDTKYSDEPIPIAILNACYYLGEIKNQSV